MSMTNGVAHGVEIYSKKLSELIVEQPPYIYIHLYLKKVKFLSFFYLHKKKGATVIVVP